MARKPNADPSFGIDEMAQELEEIDPTGTVDDLRSEEAFMEDMMSRMDTLLPDVPPPPGYHCCWLSTTHERDFIGQRETWGYTPYRKSEMPDGYRLPNETHTAEGGAQDDLIRIREMVLYKVPVRRAEAMMTIGHYRRPRQMIEALDPTNNPLLHEMKDRKGTPLIKPEGDGIGVAMKARRGPPVFFPAQSR